MPDILTLDLDAPTVYAAWIARHVLDNDVATACAFWTDAMQRIFPELTRVRGHVQPPAPVTGRPQGYAHWWLVTPDGLIVDPTAAQYPWPLTYVPWPEGQAEPTGRCVQCGDHAYAYQVCCSDACGAAFVAALAPARRRRDDTHHRA